MGAGHALSPSRTGAQAFATRVAALVCSAVSGAEDPRTLAITILNCAPVPRGGRVDLFPRLIDEAASYELVDDRGVPVPHTWIGEPGRAPSVLTLACSELPDLTSALARTLACLPPASHVAELSVWTSGQTVHLEVTAGEVDAVDDAGIGDAAILAGCLARRAACSRACITVHQSTSMHVAATVPAIPACGYSTLLLRPRAKPSKGRVSRMAMLGLLPPDLCDQAPLSPLENDEHLCCHVGRCAEGVLPPSGPLLTVQPSGVVLDAFLVEGDGQHAVVHMHNRRRVTYTARIGWQMPVTSVEMLDASDRHCLVTRAGESCTGLEALVPAQERLSVRLGWA
jgi:hypothetical protein